jgi:hypothetical protein
VEDRPEGVVVSPEHEKAAAYKRTGDLRSRKVEEKKGFKK